MELPGLTARATALLVVGTLMVAAAPAAAAMPATTRAPVATPILNGALSASPVLVTSQTKPPRGYRLNARKVERIAFAVKSVRATVSHHRGAYPAEYTRGPGWWQVSWFTRAGKEIAQVYIYDATGKVVQAWTGFQVAWTMARGYPGAFGRRVNALYVWLPLCLLFLAPFLPWRKGPDGRRHWSLLHLDLVVLLAFSVSLAFFNHADIGLSVPLAYPCLLYLLVRLLALAAGRGRPRRLPGITVPARWLPVAIIFLVGFRVGLNITDSNVIDVGYAGVIGSHRLVHGHNLYGHWPSDNQYGDTYGPVNYYAYVPAYAIFGWSGSWDDLPAAHAAAILFDLLTLLGLYFLGRRVRGPTLGVMLAYAWSAYPFTLYTLSSNSNDSLVAMLIVAALLAITSASARGAFGALAGLTKFAPIALGPLLLRGVGPVPRPGRIVAFVGAYAATAAVAMLPVFLDHNWHAFWQDSIAYQAQRSSPFSIWGLWGGLSFEQHLVQGAAAMLAVLVAFFPSGRRALVQTAALGGAVLIAMELGTSHWFYLYIVWFFPLAMLALLGAEPSGSHDSGRRFEHLLDRLRPHRLSGRPDHDSVQPRVLG